MFYPVSKIGWLFAMPSNLISLALIVAALLLLAHRTRGFGAGLLAFAIALLVVFGLGPGGEWLVSPLQLRFPPPSRTLSPYGIIVLGGAVNAPGRRVDPEILETNEAGERLTALLVLARRYPDAKLVFTGGAGGLLDQGPAEADIVKARIGALGLDPARIIFENRSRNTYENALFTKQIVEPKSGQTWFLITSAWHMPRAMGCFREQGFDVQAFPVDYRAGNWHAADPTFIAASSGLLLTDVAVREWIGLLVYRLTGKIGALFPAP